MPKSKTAQDLLNEGKLYYGDPCYDSTFGSTKEECERVTQGESLAHAVLEHYNIDISDDWVIGPRASENACCCPLDILNQDPIQCMKMSLSSSLLDEEYWEVYADEFGKARFIKVLPEDQARQAVLPRIQFCVPSLQPADIANLVVVRAADPPPFRKCGLLSNGQEWYDVIDGSVGPLRGLTSLFPTTDSTGASDAKGIMFTWGEVTGYESMNISPTCEYGKFNQYGTVIYPDYERKQIYHDGVVDLFELEGFEQLLFWLTDISYNSTDEEMRHYAIQFVKSSDVPVHLGNVYPGETLNGHEIDFGPVCDIGGAKGTGSTPDIALNYRTQWMDMSCTSVQHAMAAARQRHEAYVTWLEYSVPSFFGYGHVYSNMSFKDYSKWNIVGVDKCLDNPMDSLYESTTNLWANGSPLEKWNAQYFMGCTLVNFGTERGRKTMELPQATVWVESKPLDSAQDQYNLIYSLRAEAPISASIKSDLFFNGEWYNGLYRFMLTYVDAPHAANCTSSFDDGLDTNALNAAHRYSSPGYLFGWEDGLYLVNELWAKIKVARPGISIQGFGKGVDSFLPKIRLRVKPVYQVDFPAAIAAAGETYNGCVDAYKDLTNANHSYCEELETETDAEKLQEAMTGNTIDITLPFLFPDYKAVGQLNPSQVTNKDAFARLCDDCYKVAQFLWNYINKYKNEANKSFTYTCGPPKTQDEVPRLGDAVETEHGIRTVHSLAYSYSDNSSFTLTVDVGPVSISQAHTGNFLKKKTSQPDVKGKIVDQVMGALYKVDIPHLGVIKAWNISKYPWDIGDKVTVTLYNHPAEL